MASTDSSYDQERELQQQGSNNEDAESSSHSQDQDSEDEKSSDVGGRPSWGDDWAGYCSKDHETIPALSISPLAGITMCSEKLLLNHIRQDGQDEKHLVISMGQIRAGYQFPLYDPANPLLLRLLKHINKHPAQLSGNSIRILYEWVARSNGCTLYPNITRNQSFIAKELYTVENFIDQYQVKPSSRAGEPWLYRIESRRGSNNSKKFLRDVDKESSTTENPTVRHKSENRWGEIPCLVEGPWLKGFEDENQTIPREAFLSEHSDLATHDFCSVRWDEENQYLKKDGEFVVGERKKWVKKPEFCKPPTNKGQGTKRKGKEGDAVEQPKKKSKPAAPVSRADRVKGLIGALPGMNTAGAKKNESVKPTAGESKKNASAAKNDGAPSKKKDSGSSRRRDEELPKTRGNETAEKDCQSSKNDNQMPKVKKSRASKGGNQPINPATVNDLVSEDQSVKPAIERPADEMLEEIPITPGVTTSTTATTGQGTAEMDVDIADENTIETYAPEQSTNLIGSASASATNNIASALHHLLSLNIPPCPSAGNTSAETQLPANKLVEFFAKLLSQDESGSNTLYLESMSKLSEPGLALKPADLTTAVSNLTPYEQFCIAVMNFQRNLGGITLNAQLKQELINLRQAKAKVDDAHGSLKNLLAAEKKESYRHWVNYNQQKKKVDELQGRRQNPDSRLQRAETEIGKLICANNKQRNMLVSLGRDVKWYRQELRNITDLNVNLDHLLKVSEADVAWKKSELDNASRLTELERKGKEKMTVEHMKLSSQLKEKEATISRLSSTLVCRTAERDSARTEIQHHKDFAQIHGNRARELNEENAILRQKIKQAVGPCSDHEVLSKLDEISTAKKGIQEYVSGLEEKNKKLESQLEEQTITLEEHSGCTAKIADLEGQIKDHQACRDKLRALETDNMQCTGKITNLANEVKTLQDYKMKFDDEASKSAKLQRMHDGLKSELRLSKKSIRNLEEENASDVRVAGFYAVQMFLATFCADHKLDIPADYAPGRDPPDMEATPIVADDEGDAENAIRIHSGSDDESAEEEENAEDDRDLQPKTHDSHHDGGKDASIGNEPDTPEYQRQDANDPNQGKGGASTNAEEEDKDTSTKDPNMVNNP